MEATPGRSPQRYPYGCASCFTIIGTIVLSIVLLLARCSAETAPSTGKLTLSPPLSLTGSVVVGTDDRTLIYSSAELCREGSLTAVESAQRVELSVRYQSDDPLSGTCGSRVQPQPSYATARLAAPLGDRTVVDALTGSKIAVFHANQALRLPPAIPSQATAPQATIPRVTDPRTTTSLVSTPWTPPPPKPSSPLDEWPSQPAVATEATDFGGPGAATIALRYSGRHQSATGTNDPDDTTLVVVATTGTWTPDPVPPTTPVTVRGHPGRAALGIVVWTENGITYALRVDAPQQAPRPTDQLLALAALLQNEWGTIP